MATTYHSTIKSVTFVLGGTETARRDSYVEIRNSDLFRGGVPSPGGMFDAHLGTVDYEYTCQTCHNPKKHCLGHDGHINMRYPVINPMAMRDLPKWLKITCFKCGKPVTKTLDYLKLPRAGRLAVAYKEAEDAKLCNHCGETHGIVRKDPKQPLRYVAEYYKDDRKYAERVLFPHVMKEILGKITDETVINLGGDPVSHPRNFILDAIKVPSVLTRPDVKKIGGGRSTNDDLTTMLQLIEKLNETMPNIVDGIIDLKAEKHIYDMCTAYYNFIKGGADTNFTSIGTRLKGKQGKFRKAMLGKRTRKMCRSTITGDPRLKVDEVGIPLVFAKTIQMKEIVQDFNRQRMLSYIANGVNRYPGCTKIVKKSTGAEYLVSSFVENEHDLENGDTVHRDIINGDMVFFNRQPSLKNTNITALKAVICEDPRILTLRMNVIDTKLFNADFDGDQMNLIIQTTPETRNEIGQLASASEWLLSYTTSAPEMGQVDDSIIGLFELTRSRTQFDKFHAMLLFQNVTTLPSIGTMFEDPAVKYITGRDVISLSLQETPINFVRATEFYKEHLAQYMKYDPSEIKVKIEQGKLLSGVLDKKSIGANSNGGIYHIIANEYGCERALEVMFNMQQLAIGYMLQYGFTIGVQDLLVDEHARSEISKVASDILNKSYLITERLNNGNIVPPVGKTVAQFYEEQQINNLVAYDEFIGPIMSSIDPDTNNLFKLVMSGSKGKIEQVYNMMSAVGQKLINGDRILEKFGFKRTLPYYSRFCTTPASRGYIDRSYVAGLTSPQYINNADASRFDLISKALSTSVTGKQNRDSIKNLESITVNHMRASTKGDVIIQFAYGDNYVDTRKVERCKFPTVMLSDADFAAKYRNDTFPQFFAQMQQDREKFRQCFLQVENISIKEMFSDERRVPVNVERTVIEHIRDYADVLTEPSEGVLAEMVALTETLCANLHYLLTNDHQERNKTQMPEVMHCAVWLTCMQVRSYLHPNALVALKMTPKVLLLIHNRIRDRYLHALIGPGTAVGIIAAQSFSEPLTQYMLDAHHRSAAGGTSKSGMVKADEVLGAQPVEKLSGPIVTIRLKREFEGNRAKVQEIANNIEVMKLKQFVTSLQIFFEKFGEIVHPDYLEENKMIAEFMKMNPILKPANLARWCIRFAINKTTLILKNMSVETIVSKLRDIYPETFIVYNSENSRHIVMRLYIQNSLFKQSITTDVIKQFKDQLLNTTIRGVDGVMSTNVIKMPRNVIADDGAVVRRDEIYAIQTSGTNMAEIFVNRYVDALMTHSDAVREIEKILGIEAARQKIITEMRNLVDACNYTHYTMYADEMTQNGRVTNIKRSGLSARESSNMHLRIAFSSPLQTLEEASLTAAKDTIGGFSAPLLIGTVPRIGTLYTKVIINEDFVRENVKKASEYLDDL